MRLFAATLLLFLSTIAAAAEISAEDLDRRRKALNDLLDEQWEYSLRTSPEYASLLGDKRWNDQVSDSSEAEVLREYAETRKFLRRFEAIGTAGFSDQEKLNRDLMVRNLREHLDAQKFKPWLTPVSQFNGLHLFLPQLPSMLSFNEVKDYRDYIARLRKMPKQFDDVTARMRKGMQARLMEPRFLLEKVAEQAEQIATQKVDDSPFARPLAKMPDTIPPAEQARTRADYLDAVRNHVLPAYAKFGRFVREEYAPRGRKEAGVWSLPDGPARYENAVARLTTTNLSPERIHDIGLREVGRIEAEMVEIARALGYSDLKTFNAAIEKKPDLRAKSRQHIIDLYKQYTAQMYAKLPQLFGRLPKAKIEIVPTEDFREKTAAGADYNSGALDGSRPGRVNVNTYDAGNRKIISFESTAYHEGVPGHHMQISIAQELTDLPKFRREGDYTGFVEGWALYSEGLGKEVGFYQDPYSDYGRLQDEMLRAIRLVVDTGLHEKKWSRDDVVQYFRGHSAIDEVDIQSETDRYIVWPGQALAYKLGQLKIVELRERARIELGQKFDIRAFHDEVLGAGALPLSTLEERIDDWIARTK
jgi:uncharacterized protein (DUF885 family)